MSTYWRFRCAEHGDMDESDGINHGKGTLRSLAALREPYNALRDADLDGELDIQALGHGSVVMWFLREHRACALELVSEYGDVEPVDLRCGVLAAPYQPELQCERQAGHSGWHFATWERHKAKLEWQR